jgi:para-nitrobenzyl esterase
VGDYWTQFARTGNPNGKDLPHWPAYDSLSGSCLELGEERKQMQVPNREGYAVFEHILQVRLREAGGR